MVKGLFFIEANVIFLFLLLVEMKAVLCYYHFCSWFKVVMEAWVTAIPSSFKFLEKAADSFSGLILKDGVLL